MADDPFAELLDLEDGFYKEGYDAGVADSSYAGMIEGKTFGVEKGYSKAVEVGMLHGRGLVWEKRSTESRMVALQFASPQHAADTTTLKLAPLPKNTRLLKHIQSLRSTTDDNLPLNNSDEAVTEFEERTNRAHAKAKIIANIVGEISSSGSVGAAIEDTQGLDARH